MNKKVLLELEQSENERVRRVAKFALTLDIDFKDAEWLLEGEREEAFQL